MAKETTQLTIRLRDITKVLKEEGMLDDERLSEDMTLEEVRQHVDSRQKRASERLRELGVGEPGSPFRKIEFECYILFPPGIFVCHVKGLFD